MALTIVLSTDSANNKERRYALEVLGSTVRFAYEPTAGVLSVTATHSADLPPTYAENWLGEPLRILFGQLIYPRLVARNLGDGSTHVFIRPLPALVPGTGWAALWPGNRDRLSFWERYMELLSLIARARDVNGQPNFEGHKITQLYEELVQASHGSRWVWALTFASTVEALVKMLITRPVPRADVDAEAVDSLTRHIKAWSGPKELKDAAVRATRGMITVTTAHKMGELQRKAVISKQQIESWRKIRNSVMHGNLLSPYSSKEEDSRLLDLATMVHALTLEVLRRCRAGSTLRP